MFKTGFGIGIVVILIAAIIGWVINLVEVIQWVITDPVLSETGALMFAKFVGIFIPFIGAILGYV